MMIALTYSQCRVSEVSLDNDDRRMRHHEGEKSQMFLQTILEKDEWKEHKKQGAP